MFTARNNDNYEGLQ